MAEIKLKYVAGEDATGALFTTVAGSDEEFRKQMEQTFLGN